MKLKIKKGDIIKVITGSDKGKTGRVLDIDPKAMRILVEQVNVRSKHTKPSQMNPQGGINKIEMPIHYSNVMLIDSDKKATRIGLRREVKDGKATVVRFARSNGKEL